MSAGFTMTFLDSGNDFKLEMPREYMGGTQLIPGPQGEPGIQSPPGPAGSDASVTTENITAALGYTPADGGEVRQLKEDLANMLPKSPSQWGEWTAEEQTAAQERLGILSVEEVLF